MILCDRECCQVVSQKGKNRSNIELIKECLLSDDADSRKNAVKLILQISNGSNKTIKDMGDEEFMSDLPSPSEAIVKNEPLKDEVKDIIKNIFSKENIGSVLWNKSLMLLLPSLLGDMIKNESLKDEAKHIIKNMSSYKNFGSILERVDTSLERFVSRNIVKGLAKEMLEKEYKDFESKAPHIIKNPISLKNITTVSSSSSAQKEMLNSENSSARDGINGSLKSNISRLNPSSTQKGMSDYRNKTEDSASDFIRNILGNNSINKQFKSELKALLDDFSAKRRKFIPQALIEKEEKTRNRKLAVLLRK